MQIRKQQWLQVLCCSGSISCVVANTQGLDGTEFGAGSVTGKLVDMIEIGGLLFMLAVALTLFSPRVAATVALVPSLLCLPLYLYLVAPGPFRWLFRGEYAVPLTSNFAWTRWPVAGIVALAVTAWVCFRGFFAPNQKHQSEP